MVSIVKVLEYLPQIRDVVVVGIRRGSGVQHTDFSVAGCHRVRAARSLFARDETRVSGNWRFARVMWMPEPARAAASRKGQSTSMKESFVFIFRQGSRKLIEEEQRRRTEEVRNWALRQIEENRGLDPRVLGQESARLGPMRLRLRPAES